MGRGQSRNAATRGLVRPGDADLGGPSFGTSKAAYGRRDLEYSRGSRQQPNRSSGGEPSDGVRRDPVSSSKRKIRIGLGSASWRSNFKRKSTGSLSLAFASFEDPLKLMRMVGEQDWERGPSF